MLGSGADMIDAYGIATPLLGLVVAFGSALLAMRWMVGYLERHGVAVFGYYRLAAAAILALLMVTEVV
jgi:undecaprenyl-diphosphatase